MMEPFTFLQLEKYCFRDYRIVNRDCWLLQRMNSSSAKPSAGNPVSKSFAQANPRQHIKLYENNTIYTINSSKYLVVGPFRCKILILLSMASLRLASHCLLSPYSTPYCTLSEFNAEWQAYIFLSGRLENADMDECPTYKISDWFKIAIYLTSYCGLF